MFIIKVSRGEKHLANLLKTGPGDEAKSTSPEYNTA